MYAPMMYECMYVRMYVCMYLFVHVFVWTDVCVWMHVGVMHEHDCVRTQQYCHVCSITSISISSN